MQKTYKKYFALFVLPTLIAFTLFFIVPFIMGIVLSFCKFTTVTNAHWVGIANYVKAFSNKDFMNALLFTVKFTVVSVITINVISFALAYGLTRGLKGTNIFRTIFFMPNLIGGIVLGYIWQLLINGVLAHFNVTITADPKYGFWGMVILMCWQQIGYMMVIYVAGFQSLPTDLIEAAQVDGASNGQIMRRIIIPLMMPSVTVCSFLTVANGFKMFDQNLALTNGAPSNASEMLAFNIYRTMYGRTGFEGVAQAKAVIFFIIVAVVAFIQNRITTSKEVEA
mgnify:CR=1 FL=1